MTKLDNFEAELPVPAVVREQIWCTLVAIWFSVHTRSNVKLEFREHRGFLSHEPEAYRYRLQDMLELLLKVQAHNRFIYQRPVIYSEKSLPEQAQLTDIHGLQYAVKVISLQLSEEA